MNYCIYLLREFYESVFDLLITILDICLDWFYRSLNWAPASGTTQSVDSGYYSGGTLNSTSAYNSGYTAGTQAVNRMEFIVQGTGQVHTEIVVNGFYTGSPKSVTIDELYYTDGSYISGDCIKIENQDRSDKSEVALNSAQGATLTLSSDKPCWLTVRLANSSSYRKIYASATVNY